MLEFNEAFWDHETQFFALAPQNDSPKDLMLSYWLNLKAAFGKPILVGFMGGEGALLSETMSDEELKNLGEYSQKLLESETENR